MKDLETAFKMCPHKPSLCIGGFPCPFKDKDGCHIADNSHKQLSEQYANNVGHKFKEWSISNVIRTGRG